MKAARVVAAIAILGLAAGAYFYRRPVTPESRAPRAASPRSTHGYGGDPARGRARRGEGRKRCTGRSAPPELVTKLNAPDGDINADLRIVDAVFAAFRAGTKDDDPVGENAEITAALMGKNKIDFAYIPKDCPAVNAKGELCDRWGTPFFFHQLAGDTMEIRSAGPDKKMWTADDVVLSPQ